MAMKHYPAEFKADAIALYRSRPGATIAQISAELGLNRETPRNWIRKDDQTRAETAPPARRPRTGTAPGTTESLEQENRRLREENADLKTEREIPRKAAACSAGEMRP